MEYERKLADSEKRAWLAESKLQSIELEKVKAQLSTANTQLNAVKSQLQQSQANTAEKEQQVSKLQSELKAETTRRQQTTTELADAKYELDSARCLAAWYQHFSTQIQGFHAMTIFKTESMSVCCHTRELKSEEVQPLLKAMESTESLRALRWFSV